MGILRDTREHEQVLFCHDAESGLRAVIAIHSTALGPALGGTRFYPYTDENQALADALRLSRGMTYKAACAGLELGGGKGVIIGDPTKDKTEKLLRAYGRFVESLAGRYITAGDVGTSAGDMDVIASETRSVVGKTRKAGGSGDTSFLTAYGVYQGMRAAAEKVWGRPALAGKRVGVAGAGKVGRNLVDLLVRSDADVIVSDIDAATLSSIRESHPNIDTCDADQLLASPIDVYAPCAMGGALNDRTVAVLQAPIICGAANNQLAHPGIDELLQRRGILYVPDFVVNAGGVIQAFGETRGHSAKRARDDVERILDTTREIFTVALRDDTTPTVAANHLAEQRIGDSNIRQIWLPGRTRSPSIA